MCSYPPSSDEEELFLGIIKEIVNIDNTSSFEERKQELVIVELRKNNMFLFSFVG
jgi:hypothetical protein